MDPTDIITRNADIIVSLLFLPSGLVYGFTWLFTSPIHLFVHFLAIISAVLVTAIASYLKHKKNCLVFYHFYFLLLSAILMILSGVVLVQGNRYVSTMLGLVAFGFIFISGLNYIYIRSTAEYRSLKISLCHLWFLLGVALTWTIAFIPKETNILIPPIQNDIMIEKRNVIIGTLIIVISSVITILIVFLQNLKNSDYKISLDEDVNCENESLEIFDVKEFDVTAKITTTKYGLDRMNLLPIRWSKAKKICASVILVVFKIRGLFLFYYPYMALSVVLNTINFGFEACGVNYWLPVLGAIISTVLYRFISPKFIFFISSAVQILLFILLTITIAVEEVPYPIKNVFLFILFISLGFGYSTPDILILDSADLKYSEIFLTVGFAIEMIPIYLIKHFYTTAAEVTILYLEDTVKIFHTISMAVIIILLIFIPLFFVPNNLRKTILEIRNTLNGFDNEVKSDDQEKGESD